MMELIYFIRRLYTRCVNQFYHIGKYYEESMGGFNEKRVGMFTVVEYLDLSLVMSQESECAQIKHVRLSN